VSGAGRGCCTWRRVGQGAWRAVLERDGCAQAEGAGQGRWAQASGSSRSGGSGSTLGARLRQPWRRSAVGKESRRLGGECRLCRGSRGEAGGSRGRPAAGEGGRRLEKKKLTLVL
jgi:hypothetical protein